MNKFILFLFLILSIKSNAQWLESSEQESIAKSEMTHAIQRSARVATLSDSIDVLYHNIHWNIIPGTGEIQGEVITRFKVGTNPISNIYFDLANSLSVDSVLFGGVPVNYNHSNAVLEIKAGATLLSGSLNNVTVIYHGQPTDAFVTDTHAGVDEVWTISEPYGAREWWPCKDQLNDKVDSIDISVTTSLGNRVGSLGVLEAIDTVGSEVTYHWKHRYEVVPYLVSIAVTNYVEITTNVTVGNTSFPVVNYVYPEDSTYADSQVRRIPRLFTLFDSLFINYPFLKEKYGHCQTQIGGGMEHQTMSTMGNFSDDLIAHELAHQWFGNYVTCASWQELWLNEGFATYLTGLAIERYNLPIFWERWKTKKINNIISQPYGSVFVSDTNNFWNLFDSRLTYNKGSYLLHMLRWKMGDDAFFSGVANYLNDPRLKFGFVTNQDLIQHLETSSNLDLTEFFNDWFYGEGYPSYNIILAGEKPNYSVMIGQTTSHPSVNFFEMPVELQFSSTEMDTLITFNNTENDQWFDFTYSGDITSIETDPNYWLVKGQSSVNVGTEDMEYSKSEPYLFPTIATDLIKLSNVPTGLKVSEIKVLDVSGKIIPVSKSFVGTRVEIAVSHLPQGVYFVHHSSWASPLRFVK